MSAAAYGGVLLLIVVVGVEVEVEVVVVGVVVVVGLLARGVVVDDVEVVVGGDG